MTAIPARVRLSLMVLASLVLVAALGIVLLAGSDDDPGQAGPRFEGSLAPAGIPPRDFTLRDQDGRTVSLASLRGEVVILSFLYSTCLDTCPLQAQQIKGALDRLGHDVPVLAVSVDPPNDTPLNARRFLLKQGMTGRMRFLLGDRATLAPIWKAYGIQPQGQDYEHTAALTLIGRDGRAKVTWFADKLFPEGLARDLERLRA